ncbi:hypothetical protein R2R35_03130 [Anaerocolumna sp. AGMB13020]|uniref:hypothetical protein n=1 Tax=Anaerocolumna sp. AGMB13020 TaxID=3081750 RepID=UPI002953AEB3|nr:hypothetical protein [Anaerocolumna sp. AGMB13020]WOO37505.1 hypothetical protein R2R35_03130 [Anaerocolumna sp. AGMB13020]
MRRNRQYNRRSNAMILLILLLIHLTGCSLALPEQKSGGDEFCGAYLVFPGDGSTYNELISSGFGVNSKGEIIQKKDNILEGSYGNDTVSFEGIDGYFIGFLKEENKDDKGIGVIADDGFSDVSNQLKVSDSGNEEIGEATFLLPTDCMSSFRAYSVYRRADGSFYLINNTQGVHIGDGSADSEYTVTIGTSLSENMDKQIMNTKKTSIKITVRLVDPVKKLVLKEMNEQDEVIATTEIRNGKEEKIPYKVMAQTSYVLVEETLSNKEKGDYMKRSVFSFGKENKYTHQCNFPGEKADIGILTLEISK